MLRFRQGLAIILGAVAASALLIFAPNAPAAAEVAQAVTTITAEQAYEARLQSFEFTPPATPSLDVQSMDLRAAPAAPAPVAVRDEFSVEMITVVQWPVAYQKINDHFGYRIPPCAGCSSIHSGTDFQAPPGTPIFATAPGVVVEIGSSGSWGNSVTIEHVIDGQLVYSSYAHMQTTPAVSVGQTVAVGEYLGPVGRTGASSGNHLHFSISLGSPHGHYIDSLVWLEANVNIDDWNL